MTSTEQTIVLTYAEVMRATKGLTMKPEEFITWKHVAQVDGESIYEGGEDQAILSGAHGTLVVLEDGAKLIKGAPTVSAAQTAASIAVRLGL